MGYSYPGQHPCGSWHTRQLRMLTSHSLLSFTPCEMTFHALFGFQNYLLKLFQMSSPPSQVDDKSLQHTVM